MVQKKASAAGKKKKTVSSSSSRAKTQGGKRTGGKKRSKKSTGAGKIRLFLLIAIPLMLLSFAAGYLMHEVRRTQPARSVKKERPKPPAAAKSGPQHYREAPDDIARKEADDAVQKYAYVPPQPPIEKPVVPRPKVEELPPPVELKKVCIILDDFGYNFTSEIRRVLDLSPNINVAILPGHPQSRKIMEYAVNSGHEVLIHAPFQGSDGANESQFIRRGASAEDVTDLLSQWFRELPLASGINNHQGSVATADLKTMEHVIAYLKQHDKFFIDSLTSPSSKGYRVARSQNLPYAKRTVPFLDNHDDRDDIMRYINQWLAQAIGRQDQIPLAIGHITKKNTRRVLIDLVPKLQEMGYELAPLSQAVTPAARLPAPQAEPAADASVMHFAWNFR